MGSSNLAQLGRSALAAGIVLGILGVAFGESFLEKAAYWQFRAAEVYPSLSFRERDRLVTEKTYQTADGRLQRIFVFASTSGDDKQTCRVVVTDDKYRVVSSLSFDHPNRLINVGFMAHAQPPILEMVRHDVDQHRLICQHLTLDAGVLQSFHYKNFKRPGHVD